MPSVYVGVENLYPFGYHCITTPMSPSWQDQWPEKMEVIVQQYPEHHGHMVLGGVLDSSALVTVGDWPWLEFFSFSSLT